MKIAQFFLFFSKLLAFAALLVGCSGSAVSSDGAEKTPYVAEPSETPVRIVGRWEIADGTSEFEIDMFSEALDEWQRAIPTMSIVFAIIVDCPAGPAGLGCEYVTPGDTFVYSGRDAPGIAFSGDSDIIGGNVVLSTNSWENRHCIKSDYIRAIGLSLGKANLAVLPTDGHGVMIRYNGCRTMLVQEDVEWLTARLRGESGL